MKKVLLTGGTGFIGSAVCDEMKKQGYEIHALIYPSDKIIPGTISYPIDLTDLKAVDKLLSENRFESMIHLAWYTGPKCHSSDINVDWTIATLNLLQVFIKYGGKKFLGAGSVSEYDYANGYLRERETPLTDESLYGICKASVYRISKSFCTAHNVDFKWARIFNLYGPNEKTTRLMPSVIRSALKGQDILVSDCLKYQDYLYVTDTARGIVDLFSSSVQDAVNICSGTPVKLRSIVEKIAELTHFKGKIHWGAVPAGFEDPVVVGDNRRLINEVGWTQQISLDEGLKQTIKWWSDQNVQ